MHDDLVIAATNQLSWDGATGERTTEATNYCDVIRKDFTGSAATYDFRSTSGLSGLKKCSYIITTAANIGAPAFKLK